MDEDEDEINRLLRDLGFDAEDDDGAGWSIPVSPILEEGWDDDEV
jgi:hypothetical protein